MKCRGCYNDVPEDTLIEVANDGTRVCPRCVFILGLYQQAGIKKTVTEGGLMPSRINARYKRILETEFNANPEAAYEKYLKPLINEAEGEAGIIRVDDSTLDKLSVFPFVLIPKTSAALYNTESGTTLTLKSKNRKVTRTIYASHVMPKRAAKKYGVTGGAVACYIPE